MNASVPTILSLIETQIAGVTEKVDTEVKRLDKKLDKLSLVLGGIFVTSTIPALQSVGIHTSAWWPEALKFVLGYVH